MICTSSLRLVIGSPRPIDYGSSNICQIQTQSNRQSTGGEWNIILSQGGVTPEEILRKFTNFSTHLDGQQPPGYPYLVVSGDTVTSVTLYNHGPALKLKWADQICLYNAYVSGVENRCG